MDLQKFFRTLPDHCHSLAGQSLELSQYTCPTASVADLGSGAFLTPESGISFFPYPGSETHIFGGKGTIIEPM